MTDLHTHTTYSDSSASVSALLKEAQALKLTHLSISDHDVIGAYSELENKDTRALFSGKIIPAVELTSLFEGDAIEVLAYGIDLDIMGRLVKKNVKPFIDSIEEQSYLYMATFKKLGVKFDSDFVEVISKTPEKIFADRRTYSQGVYLEQMRKYPENAKFFKSSDEFMNISVKDFTRNYIYNTKSPLYTDLSPLVISAARAVEFAHEAGGLAFLAHPFVYSPDFTKKIEYVLDCYDFDGVECFYPTFTKEQSEYLCSLCDKRSLYKSGGSDFHGLDIKPDNHLGYGTEQQPIELKHLLPWIDTVKTI